MKKIESAIRKNIICSILLVLILFIVDNRSYLFDYLPHRWEYEKVKAYISNNKLRHNYVEVNVVVSEDETISARVKHGMGEAEYLEEITVGYSANRAPSVVRVNFIVSWGQICVAAVLAIGNVSYAQRLKRAWREEARRGTTLVDTDKDIW